MTELLIELKSDTAAIKAHMDGFAPRLQELEKRTAKLEKKVNIWQGGLMLIGFAIAYVARLFKTGGGT